MTSSNQDHRVDDGKNSNDNTSLSPWREPVHRRQVQSRMRAHPYCRPAALPRATHWGGVAFVAAMARVDCVSNGIHRVYQVYNG